jgi:hypothetical protein
MKKNIVKIDSGSMEDFIWMSYRYCVGRLSIASVMHADTISSLIVNNPDLLSQARKQFMANDIMSELVYNLKSNNYNKIENAQEHENYDFFAELLYKISTVDNRNSYRYTLNGLTKTITMEEFPTIEYLSVDTPYSSLIAWYKLAKKLDDRCHKRVKVKYRGEKAEFICYPYPIQTNEGTYEERWAAVDSKNVTAQQYIDPQYILSIEDI